MITGTSPAADTTARAACARSAVERYGYDPVDPSAPIESTPAPTSRSTIRDSLPESTPLSLRGVTGNALKPVNMAPR